MASSDSTTSSTSVTSVTSSASSPSTAAAAAPPASYAVIVLNDRDNVGIAAAPLAEASTITVAGGTLQLERAVNVGAKIALQPIAAGEKVYKYGAPIGSATRDIAPGQHVHTHNMQSDYIPTYDRGGHR